MPVVDLRDPRDYFFDYIWIALAQMSACDPLGSAEARRVFALWVAAGRPVGVAEFIVREANIFPEVKP